MPWYDLTADRFAYKAKIQANFDALVDGSKELTQLNVGGNVSITGGNQTVAGRILCDDTTEATTTTNGSIQTDGGLSVAKKGFFGGSVTLANGQSFSTLDNSATVVPIIRLDATNIINMGSLTLPTDRYASLHTFKTGKVNIDDTTDATTTLDGSIQTDGGGSFAKNVVIGGDLIYPGKTYLNNDASYKVVKYSYITTSATAATVLSVSAGSGTFFHARVKFIKQVTTSARGSTYTAYVLWHGTGTGAVDGPDLEHEISTATSVPLISWSTDALQIGVNTSSSYMMVELEIFHDGVDITWSE